MRRHAPGTWIEPTGGGFPGEPDADGRYSGNVHFEIGPGGKPFIVRWRAGGRTHPKIQVTASGYAVHNPQSTAMEVRYRADAEPIIIPPGGSSPLLLADLSEVMG